MNSEKREGELRKRKSRKRKRRILKQASMKKKMRQKKKMMLMKKTRNLSRDKTISKYLAKLKSQLLRYK